MMVHDIDSSVYYSYNLFHYNHGLDLDLDSGLDFDLDSCLESREQSREHQHGTKLCKFALESALEAKVQLIDPVAACDACLS